MESVRPRARAGAVVFVKCVRRAKIAEVPVKCRMVLDYVGGDSGHHHIAAISRIAGDA